MHIKFVRFLSRFSAALLLTGLATNVRADNTAEEKFFFHQSNTGNKTDFHFTVYSDIDMKLESASSDFPNNGHSNTPEWRKEHEFNWSGMNVPESTIIKFNVKFTQKLKNYLRLKDVYWTPTSKSGGYSRSNAKVPGPPGFEFGPTYSGGTMYRIFNDSDTSMTVQNLQFRSSSTYVNLSPASYPLPGFGSAVSNFTLNPGEYKDFVMSGTGAGFLLAQGICALGPEQTSFIQEHEEFGALGIPTYPVDLGSLNNPVSVTVCNPSQFYPLPGCTVRVESFPSFLTNFVPTSSSTHPQDIGPAQTGLATFHFDVSTTASPGDSGNVVFRVSSALGVQDSRTFAVKVAAPAAVPGDANGDGNVDISDAVYLIQYIFAGGPAPVPLCAGDANCDGSVDISDAVYLIAYIFAGGPPPCNGC